MNTKNDNAEIDKVLESYKIYKLDNISVSICNKEFNFSYTIADKVVKDEFKGKYKYFGGLQCNYTVESELYNLLETRLAIIAEKILK
jgi:hypothetical protein